MKQAPLSLLLEHGWAFDASLWQTLNDLAPWPTQSFDAGYFGVPKRPLPEEPYIAVGHSLGAMKSLLGLAPACQGLVLINGFTRFSAAPDFPQGLAQRLLARMASRIEADTAAVVGDFRQRCGAGVWPERPTMLDGNALLEDLNLLRDGDARSAYADLNIPVLALAGDADPIATPALTEACFIPSVNRSLQWCEGGGHLLPVTHAEWCIEHIQNFINDLQSVTPGQLRQNNA